MKQSKIMATYYEKSPPKFAVGETVYINEHGEGWAEGEVLEVGDETILVQWNDLSESTEHPASEWYMICHNYPSPIK